MLPGQKTSRKHFFNLKYAKHVILWSTPRTLFYEAPQERFFEEARHARDFMKHANFLKHAKHAILRSTPSTPIFWSTPSMPFQKARQAQEHVRQASMSSTPFSRLTWSGLSVKFLMLGKTNFMVAYHLMAEGDSIQLRV